ncbi:MAG: carbohydrate-binding domain-containing protein [Saccharofermentans sp.]|nr:carbohydrate-binding domain-containing protein [Saccharofermentans sp.]
MKKFKIITTALVLSVMMAGCTALAKNETQQTSAEGNVISSVEELSITDKDLVTDYEESEAEEIRLTDSTGTVKITEAGAYIITGSTSDGMIIVEASEEDDVQLILRDASITSSSSAAIYVISADEVYITLEGENSLANGGAFEAIDENDIDAVIYAKDDLTINGSGSLKITSPAGHGIVCKDDMVIASGTFDITASEDGINTNESLAIVDCDMTVNAGDDAVHTDGMLQIGGGTLNITAAEGLEGTYIVINDGKISISASDDGINAAQKSDAYAPTVEINGGEITIVMGQGDTDGIDSNGNIVINGGTIDITGQFAVDYIGTATLNGGTLIINGEETDTIPNQFMGGAGGGMMNGAQGDPGFDPRSSGERQMPEDFDPENMPQMPQDGGNGLGTPGERSDRQQEAG